MREVSERRTIGEYYSLRCKNPEIGRVAELTIMTITDTDLHQAQEKTKARKFQETIYINTNSMRYCPK